MPALRERASTQTCTRYQLVALHDCTPSLSHGAVLISLSTRLQACTGSPDWSLHLLTREAVQILGGNGYVNEYPAARLLRDAKLYEIGGSSLAGL
jgi:hypothetical protein